MYRKYTCDSTTTTTIIPIISSKLRLERTLTTRCRLPIVKVKPGEKAPPVRTQQRSATILPNFVGLRFEIHNGKIYHEVTITEDMVGHKLGEFSPYVLINMREKSDRADSGLQDEKEILIQDEQKQIRERADLGISWRLDWAI